MFDTHAHLTGSELLPDVEGILQRAQAAGVKRIVNICTDADSLKEGLALAKRTPWVYNAGSTTPHDVAKEGEAYFELFAQAARSRQLVAVGETGLDYHYEHSPRDLQRQFLIRYLQLALECKLPVIFHCRDAFADLFEICDSEYLKNGRAILHCFTGTVEEAQQGIERGWMISFSGIVTFKKSEALREAARVVPLHHLLIETDAPYLAPQSKRGQRNEPGLIGETLACLANLKGMAVQELERITSENARRVFGLI